MRFYDGQSLATVAQPDPTSWGFIMIIAHYTHRLPAGHDLDAIRQRARERGSIWDERPGLYFKAFLLREAGRYGAVANSFSSLYLWRQDTAFRDWLVGGGYGIVTESFGRAEIEPLFALDAFRGKGGKARFLYREEIGIPPDTELTAAFAAEIDRARGHAAQPDVVAAAVGLDPHRWRFVQVLLSEKEPAASEPGVAYQIAHLSRPLLDSLPQE
ncbi:DUF4865 family protein [Azospirillum endophyticum]